MIDGQYADMCRKNSVIADEGRAEDPADAGARPDYVILGRGGCWERFWADGQLLCSSLYRKVIINTVRAKVIKLKQVGPTLWTVSARSFFRSALLFFAFGLVPGTVDWIVSCIYHASLNISIIIIIIIEKDIVQLGPNPNLKVQFPTLDQSRTLNLVYTPTTTHHHHRNFLTSSSLHEKLKLSM